MAIRKRTTKLLARRHDLDYFKKGSPIRLWQWRLAAVLLIAAALWIALTSWRSSNAFSAGPMSASHAVFGQRCETCHVPVVRGVGWMPVIGARRKVPDNACLSCHQVGPHHAEVSGSTAACSTCHVEHVGAHNLAFSPVRGCTQCHSDLGAHLVAAHQPQVATHIVSFVQGHPDFRPLSNVDPQVRDAAFGLKFNHEEHLKELATPEGGDRHLTCANCHTLSDLGERGTARTGRMQPVDFDRSCRSCHTLDFDRRIHEQAPHADSATVLHFVQEKMSVAAPGDGTALVKAEAIVFRDKCALCHTVSGVSLLPRALDASFEAPVIAPARQPVHFFPSSVFSHSAHDAVQCTECHASALASNSGKDLLLPGIAVCQKCHDGQSNPQGTLPVGHAESGCALCHDYHEGGRQHGRINSTAFTINDLLSSH